MPMEAKYVSPLPDFYFSNRATTGVTLLLPFRATDPDFAYRSTNGEFEIKEHLIKILYFNTIVENQANLPYKEPSIT